MTWTWTYAGADGSAVTPAMATEDFLTQAVGVDWIGPAWRARREEGLTAVTLHEDDRVVYGPMSLSA